MQVVQNVSQVNVYVFVIMEKSASLNFEKLQVSHDVKRRQFFYQSCVALKAEPLVLFFKQ